MEDYKALADALRRCIQPQNTSIHIGVKLAMEIVEALEAAADKNVGNKEE